MHKQRWKPAVLDQWAGSRDSGLGTSTSSLPDLPSQSTSSITHTATIPRNIGSQATTSSLKIN